jgi:two-component sensor histidine kinase
MDMSDRTEAQAPLVEPKVQGSQRPEVSQHALEVRIRQQEILAELGVSALQGKSFPELVDQTVQLTAEGLEVEFCNVMEYIAADKALVVRAGIGWDPKVIGTARVGADLGSPAGYALRTGKPVISNHLEHEQRFRTPELLLEYGIHRAMNVILQGEHSAYGVLEVDSRSPGEFTEYDIAFLRGVANILGMAIERQRTEEQLRSAVEKHKVLLRELNHRVKNSLQLVSNMLRLQASGTADESPSRRDLTEASNRVSAIARAHENLYRGLSVERIDIGQYLLDICDDIRRSADRCSIEVSGPEGVLVHTDRAIPIALIVNELVTNGVKHAHSNESSNCRILVSFDRSHDQLSISVRDNGTGLPEHFDLATTSGLGLRIVTALVKQLGADLTARTISPGAEFVLRMTA